MSNEYLSTVTTIMDLNADIPLYIRNLKDEFDMHSISNRLKSFQDWPFKEKCSCTPEKLAAAGFVYCGSAKEPDLVKCYVCLKELDGWEPEDDPWEEHVKHSVNCAFIKHNNIALINLKEFLELEQARALRHIEKYIGNSNATWNDNIVRIQERLANTNTDEK